MDLFDIGDMVIVKNSNSEYYQFNGFICDIINSEDEQGISLDIYQVRFGVTDTKPFKIEDLAPDSDEQETTELK